MASRQSTLRQTFDPATFHRTAAMSQSGWAEHELRQSRHGINATLRKHSSLIILILGTLLVAAVRPPDVMDGRDLIVSGGALLASLVVGFATMKLVMTVVRSEPEIERIVSWSIALLVGLALASTGTVATLARDADDFLVDIPGYTMTSSPDLKNLELQSLDSELFADVGLWQLQRDHAVAGSLGVFLIADQALVSKLGPRKFLSQALNDSHGAVRSKSFAGKDVYVATTGGQTQVGWLDGSAVLVLSGGDRVAVESAAAAMIRKGR